MIRLSGKKRGKTFILGLLTGYRGWALLGLVIAVGAGVLQVYLEPAEQVFIAPSTHIAPAAAPKETPAKLLEKVVPDTVNGELVWPDPWDQIVEPAYRGY